MKVTRSSSPPLLQTTKNVVQVPPPPVWSRNDGVSPVPNEMNVVVVVPPNEIHHPSSLQQQQPHPSSMTVSSNVVVVEHNQDPYCFTNVIHPHERVTQSLPVLRTDGMLPLSMTWSVSSNKVTQDNEHENDDDIRSVVTHQHPSHFGRYGGHSAGGSSSNKLAVASSLWWWWYPNDRNETKRCTCFHNEMDVDPPSDTLDLRHHTLPPPVHYHDPVVHCGSVYQYSTRYVVTTSTSKTTTAAATVVQQRLRQDTDHQTTTITPQMTMKDDTEEEEEDNGSRCTNSSTLSLTYSVSPPPSSSSSDSRTSSSSTTGSSPSCMDRRRRSGTHPDTNPTTTVTTPPPTTRTPTIQRHVYPMVVALSCCSLPDHNKHQNDDDTCIPNPPPPLQDDDTVRQLHDIETEIPLSPLTFVSLSSTSHRHNHFQNDNVVCHSHRWWYPNTNDHHSHSNSDHEEEILHPYRIKSRMDSSNTIYTLRPQQHIPATTNHGMDVPLGTLLSPTIVQEYHIVQTLRRQSLLYNNYNTTSCHWYYGTTRLSNYLDDMDFDLHYIMTKKVTMTCCCEQEQYPYYDHPTIPVPKEEAVEGNGIDPVIQWETYMEERHDAKMSCTTTTTNHWPIFTYTLMILCTIVLFVSFHMNEWTMESFRDNSSFGPSSETLIQMGVLSTKLLLATPTGPNTTTMEWYRIITTIAIHGGILHWVSSMMTIVYIGVPMERRYGTIWIGGTFLVTSVAANICTLIYSPFEFILSPMGGICSWYGLRLSFICSHYWTLRQLYTVPTSVTTLSTTTSTTWMSSSVSPLSRTITKTPKQFPFCVTQVAIFLEIFFFLFIGLLPWINQFSNCCGLLYGMVIGLYLFQPSGSTYKFIQTYRQASFLEMSNDKSKVKLLRTLQGWMYHLYLPIQRRIVPGMLLCTVIGFSTSNVFYLYYSVSIGDLPCRSCHYVDCVPWPDALYQHCEPCNYIEITYVTIEDSSTVNNADDDTDDGATNAITIWSTDHIVYDIDTSTVNNADVAVGTNYFIEMLCPYGESTLFVIPKQLPQNRKEWLQTCHKYCDLE